MTSHPISTRRWAAAKATSMVPPDPNANWAEDDRQGLLTVTEAAQQAGVSIATVSNWVTRGHLPATRIGGRRYIRPADLAATQGAAHLGAVVPAWRQNRQHAARRLRLMREAAGLTQLDVAAASGLTHETISRLEHGQHGAGATAVRQLAHALGVAPEQFVTDDPMGLTMLSTAEAAFQLGVPVGRVEKWLREGVLDGNKVSGQWRVPAIVVYELARSGRLRGHSRRLDPRYRG